MYNTKGVKTIAVLIAGLLSNGSLIAQEIEETLVTGSRASLQSALNKMRDSDKASGVVDSDAIGTFADINVAESLRRIPGIMVENDQGEGRYVSVRGINTDLNAMTINGVNAASLRENYKQFRKYTYAAVNSGLQTAMKKKKRLLEQRQAASECNRECLNKS